ncbi:PREDICTED: regulator of chromosome condensation-like [Priapulus caudatus]|uniref:Regulator of chromosome condensation-like n=1 Tax=Priapulus caudatus TaxID=37621 RepID=A0ABM1DNC0_PRICU|nr:PREDICTED: regulator of chromosome condensation-like [Priapulus caudatus]
MFEDLHRKVYKQCHLWLSQVYTFGCNDDGALGRSTTREGSETTPGRVTLDGPAAAVSAGDSHTAALMTDGRVFAWGSFRDSSGLMGLTGAGPQPSPTQLLESVRVAQIASGSDHLACLSDGGDIYTCGCAEQGQLGRVAEVFAKRGGRRGLGFVLEPGIVHCKRVRGKTIQFDKIWAGQYVTFARSKASGDVYAFGLNNYCQLGLPQKVHSAFMPQQAKTFDNKCWVKINGGQHHTLALDDQGRVYSLGRKEYGRLGLGEEGDDQASPTLLTSLSGVTCTDVACGSCVSYAVTEEGAAYAWGMGTNGQLGNGNDDDDRWTPERMSGRALQTRAVLRVSAGGQHSVLLAGDRPPAAAAPGDPSQVSSTTDAAGLRPGVAENGVAASACNEAVPATASS